MAKASTPSRPPDRDTVMAALADPTDRCLVQRCIPKARSVRDLAEGCGLPLPTCYRHVNDLMDRGLLFRERSALTPEGKVHDLYRSTLRRIRATLTADGLKVDTELAEDAAERLRRAWTGIREGDLP